jgi:predicted aspartyl protease
MAGVGQAAIGPDEEGTGIVRVKIDGQEANLILDLDSSYTLIGEELAERLGLPAGEPFVAWDGDRVRNGRLVVLNQVTLDEARADKVAAVVVKQAALASEDGAVIGVQGVLGLTFLSRFALSTRPEDEALVLEPKLAD